MRADILKMLGLGALAWGLGGWDWRLAAVVVGALVFVIGFLDQGEEAKDEGGRMKDEGSEHASVVGRKTVWASLLGLASISLRPFSWVWMKTRVGWSLLVIGNLAGRGLPKCSAVVPLPNTEKEAL